MKLTQRTINFFLNLLFPSDCFGCNKKGEIICEQCLVKIIPAERETDRKIMAVFDYRDPVIKKIIWQLKYHQGAYLGQKLGYLIYDELLEDIMNLRVYTLGQPIWVIPVPISKDKNKKRGYNQAEKIAKGFCLASDKKTLILKNKIVYKKIENTPQAQIANRAKRLKNIKGLFQIKKPELVKNRTIIVLDDVTTTGGTLNEIITLLEASGAKKVVGIAVAH